MPEVVALAKVNPQPPAGFQIQPAKPKDHHKLAETVTALVVAGLVGYAAWHWHRELGALAQGLAPSPGETGKVMLFGGSGHRVYLGCLSCSEADLDSVVNPAGPHGSPASHESIWNKASEFGSLASEYSACSTYAKDPPVIVDANGDYLGRLTMNTHHPQIGKGTQLYDWLSAVVC